MCNRNKEASSVKLSGLHHHVAVSSPVCQQVSVEVGFAGVALGTVDAGVGTDVAVGQHVFLQVELPP